MTNYKKIIIISIALILIISGCDKVGGGGQSSGSISSGKGVTLETRFPEYFWEKQDYKNTIILKNHMPEDITNLKIKASGVDTSLFEKLLIGGSNNEYTNPDGISKRLKELPRVLTLDFEIESKDLRSDYNANLNFKYCYIAKSIYGQQICIPQNRKDNCEKSSSGSPNSHGDLSISLSELQTIGDDIIIILEVSNSGSGTLIDITGGADRGCFQEQRYTSQYTLDNVKLGVTDGDCSAYQSSNYELTESSSGYIRCTFTRTSDGEYSTQLSAELTYKYLREEIKSITIRDDGRP